MADVQIVLNELLNWKSAVLTKNQNLNGLRITNCGAGVDKTDVAIVSQLPVIPPPAGAQVHTVAIVFSSTGPVSDGQTSAPYSVGRGRAGSSPWEVHLAATGAPVGSPLTANLQFNGTNILVSDISLAAGDNGPEVVSNFVTPLPILSYKGLLTAVVTQASGASLVSVTLIIKLSPQVINF